MKDKKCDVCNDGYDLFWVDAGEYNKCTKCKDTKLPNSVCGDN